MNDKKIELKYFKNAVKKCKSELMEVLNNNVISYISNSSLDNIANDYLNLIVNICGNFISIATMIASRIELINDNKNILELRNELLITINKIAIGNMKNSEESFIESNNEILSKIKEKLDE